MGTKNNELPPELDPAQGDAALEHGHLPGMEPGKRVAEEPGDVQDEAGQRP